MAMTRPDPQLPLRAGSISASSTGSHPAPRLVGAHCDEDEDSDRRVHQHEELDLSDGTEVDQRVTASTVQATMRAIRAQA